MSAARQMPLLALVPPPERADPPAHLSLRAHIETVDGIAEAIEILDDESMTEQLRDELSMKLIEALAGTRQKVDRCSLVVGMFEHLEASAIAERERLDRRVKYYERQRERLETYVLAVLEASKLDRIEGETSTLQRKKNPAKVVIDDESLVPGEFLRLPKIPPPPPAAPDKKAIAAALKADPASCPGARLVPSFRLVRS